MKLGIHAYAWCSQWSNETLDLIDRVQSLGLDFIEIPLMCLKDMIGEDNVKIHLDTYHMNIEEKSFYEATKRAGKDLIHYHLCENDRGIPGTGLVDWDGVFRALGEMGYQGNAALESFVDCTDNMNTWVWRQLAPNGDTLLKDGVAFIRRKQKQYGLA